MSHLQNQIARQTLPERVLCMAQVIHIVVTFTQGYLRYFTHKESECEQTTLTLSTAPLWSKATKMCWVRVQAVNYKGTIIKVM